MSDDLFLKDQDKVGGLFQPTVFKKLPSPIYAFTVKDQEGNLSVIVKTKDHRDRQWKYLPYGKYSLSYNCDEQGKAYIDISFQKQDAKLIKVDKLYDHRYMVTEDGLVIDRQSASLAKPYPNPAGYVYLGNRHNKFYALHRMVARAFCDRPEHLKDVGFENLMVNHKDGVKAYNNYTNLEWCTPSENSQHAYDTGLNNYKGDRHHKVIVADKDIKTIRQEFMESGLTIAEFAEKAGLSRVGLANILKNQSRYDPEYTPDLDYIRKNGIIKGQDHVHAKLTQADVDWMRQDYLTNKNKYSYYCEKFNVSNETVKLILRNRGWVDESYTPPKSRINIITFEDAQWIRQHKYENPKTPLAFYIDKYGIKSSAVSLILSNVIHKDNNYKRDPSTMIPRYNANAISRIRDEYKTDKYGAADQLAAAYNMSKEALMDIIYNDSYYDPNYDAPKRPKQTTITDEQVKEMRLHKLINPTTTSSYYSNKYNIQAAGVGKILSNKNRYDPSYVPGVGYKSI